MLVAARYDKKIEETIGLSMIWASLLTYVCGIVYELWIAPYLVAGIAVVSALFTIVLSVRKKKIPQIFTIGFLEYLVMGTYYMLVMRNRYIIGQDGLKVYERYVSDFYHVGDICNFKNPIGLMMWKYLSLKFWPNYSEGIQLLGPVVMCIAFLLFAFSFSEKSFKDNLIKYLVGLFFIFIIPLNFRGNSGYFVMQYDFVSAMLTVYVLTAFRRFLDTKDNFYRVVILSGLIYLVQIKTTGIILAAICVLIMAGMDMILGEGEGLKRYTFSVICGVCILISKFSWSIFCRLNDGMEKFSIGKALGKLSIGMMIAVVLALLLAAAAMFYLVYKRKFRLYIASILLLALAIFGCTTLIIPGDVRLSTIVSFGKIIFSNYAVDREYGLGSMFLMPFIIAVAALPLFYLMVSRGDDNREVNKVNNPFVILISAGFVFYSSVVYLTNFYGRTITQTAKAKECERYIFVYVMIFIFVYLFLFMNYYHKHVDYKPIMAVLIVTGIFMTNKSYVYSQLVHRPDVQTFDGLNYVNITKDDRFFYIDERKEQDQDQFFFRISPASRVSRDYLDMYMDEDGRNEPLPYDEWIQQLSECTYVYIATTDENFARDYGDVFEDEIIDGRIYTVSVDGGRVSLKSIEY